jgi:hypothetical protein
LAATAAHTKPELWVTEHGFARYYFGSSLKGEAAIDWDDTQAREEFLRSVVADADRLLGTARATLERIPMGDRERLHEAAALLKLLLMQDIEHQADGARLKRGVSPDRVVSVHETPKCATLVTAQADASMGTRHRSRSIPRAS